MSVSTALSRIVGWGTKLGLDLKLRPPVDEATLGEAVDALGETLPPDYVTACIQICERRARLSTPEAVYWAIEAQRSAGASVAAAEE